MAIFTWANGVSGDWATAADWTPIGGPPNASTVIALINAPGTYTVTIANGENEIANAVTLNDAGATLSVAAMGTLTLSGTSPALTVSAGTLALTGTVAGGTIVAAGGTVLFQTSLALNATLNGVTWDGPMTLGSGANLSVLGGLRVETSAGAQPGTIDMTAGNAAIFVQDSETLDNVTVNFGGGGGDFLTNYNASGGTLTLGSAFTLNQSGGFDDLVNQFFGDAIVNAGKINVTGGGLTVFFNDFGNSGTVSVSSGGMVDLSNTSLTNSGAINVTSGGDVLLGTIVSSTGGLTIGTGGLMEATTSAAANVTFGGTGGELILDQNSGNTGTIAGFAPGDTIFLSQLAYTGTTTPTLSGSTLKVVENGVTANLTLNGSFDGSKFQLSADPASGTDVTLIACFAAGTRIAMEGGEALVEELRPGQRVLSVFGGAAPVIWIGHSHIDCQRHPNPELVWPIRIAPNAFGPGRPTRKLHLSPDHAVYLSDALVPIRLLVNGTTIRQVEVPAITYYHVELARHDVVLADGLPTETYLDTGNRMMFENAGVPPSIRLFPDFSTRSQDASSLWETRGCARLVVAGPELDTERRWALSR